MNDRPLDEVMIERFRADPDFAIELLNDILEDGDDQGELSVLLRQISAAFGKPNPPPDEAGRSRQTAVARERGGLMIPAGPEKQSNTKIPRQTMAGYFSLQVKNQNYPDPIRSACPGSIC